MARPFSVHDYYVNLTVTDLRFHGFTGICADLDGFSKPSPITWVPTETDYIPDISAFSPDGSFHIFEIEVTEEDLKKLHSLEQMAVFGTYATQNPGNYAWLVYPLHLGALANIVARDINFLIMSITQPAPQLGWLNSHSLRG